MAKISSSLHLTPDEIDALMREESRIRIATIGPGHEINLTPMTFGWADGKVYIFGRGQKVVNLRRNNTATVLLDIGQQWRDLKGIMMRGDAQVLETIEEEIGDKSLLAAQENLGEKNNLKKDEVITPYSPTASGKSRRWIVFTPRKIVSWNNEQLK